MAKLFSQAGKPIPAVIMLVLALTVASKSTVQVNAAMDVQFNNLFPNQPVEVHCREVSLPGGGGDLGHHTLVANGGRYMFTIPGTVYSKDLYRCAFQTYQKPLTYIDVFYGIGGYGNTPCSCAEGFMCIWVIGPTGISCNENKYVHKW